MAGRKIENASYLATDWQDEIESKNLLQKGFYALEFTNMDNTSVPAIAAGSSVDVDGVVYIFDSEEVISGTITSADEVYVKIVGGTTAAATLTNTAPSWNYLKNGWYSGSDRYVLKLSFYESVYTNKITMDARLFEEDYYDDKYFEKTIEYIMTNTAKSFGVTSWDVLIASSNFINPVTSEIAYFYGSNYQLVTGELFSNNSNDILTEIVNNTMSNLCMSFGVTTIGDLVQTAYVNPANGQIPYIQQQTSTVTTPSDYINKTYYEDIFEDLMINFAKSFGIGSSSSLPEKLLFIHPITNVQITF